MKRHLIGSCSAPRRTGPRRSRPSSGGWAHPHRRGRRAPSTSNGSRSSEFDLRDKPRYDLVIDRLAYWYYVPREWLKKIALMDDVYLLNSPFTFQSMEKHAAYCAMMRLGLKVPDTVLVPFKNPPDHAKWAYTASRLTSRSILTRSPSRWLSAVHEALRRRRLAGGHLHQEPRRPARGLRRLGQRLMHSRRRPPTATTSSHARCRSGRRRW